MATYVLQLEKCDLLRMATFDENLNQPVPLGCQKIETIFAYYGFERLGL